MAVRLIASDLDGTLFGPNHHPEPRTVAAVNAAREAGIHVAAVTGRTWFRGRGLATDTGARLHTFIGSNGGHRIDLDADRFVEQLRFGDDEVAEMLASIRAGLGDVGFGYELHDRIAWDERSAEILPIGLDGDTRRATAPPEPEIGRVGKLYVFHPELEREDLVVATEPHVHEGVHVTTSGAPFVEITPPGADKGAALARLAADLGIDNKDVVAFGDNHNDLLMLEWAGRGVAMGNAVPELKAVADEIADPHDEYGVAKVIEAILGA